MAKMQKTFQIDKKALEEDLFNKYGPMIANEDLRIALGYCSSEAFRQALTRKTVPIPVFTIENRRGKYALVKDLAYWLSTKRDSVLISMQTMEKS